jgi:hypothetical protein
MVQMGLEHACKQKLSCRVTEGETLTVTTPGDTNEITVLTFDYIRNKDTFYRKLFIIRSTY